MGGIAALIGAVLDIGTDVRFPSWSWILLAFLGLVVAQYLAYREERRKNRCSLRIRVPRPPAYVIHFWIYPNTQKRQHLVRMYWRFVNHAEEVRVVGMWVVWKARGLGSAFERRIPCVKVTAPSASFDGAQLDIVLPKTSQSDDLSVEFESFEEPEASEKLPRKSSYVLHVDVVGQGPLVVKLADFGPIPRNELDIPLAVEPIKALPTLDRVGSPIESA